jgi:hypothetical protein
MESYEVLIMSMNSFLVGLMMIGRGDMKNENIIFLVST